MRVDDSGLVNISPIRGHCCVISQPSLTRLLTGRPATREWPLTIRAGLATFRKPMHLKVWRSAQSGANPSHACSEKASNSFGMPRADETNEREFALQGNSISLLQSVVAGRDSLWTIAKQPCTTSVALANGPAFLILLLRMRGSLDICQPLSGARYDSITPSSLRSTLWVSCGTRFSSPPSYSHKLVFQRTV